MSTNLFRYKITQSINFKFGDIIFTHGRPSISPLTFKIIGKQQYGDVKRTVTVSGLPETSLDRRLPLEINFKNGSCSQFRNKRLSTYILRGVL